MLFRSLTRMIITSLKFAMVTKTKGAVMNYLKFFCIFCILFSIHSYDFEASTNYPAPIIDEQSCLSYQGVSNCSSQLINQILIINGLDDNGNKLLESTVNLNINTVTVNVYKQDFKNINYIYFYTFSQNQYNLLSLKQYNSYNQLQSVNYFTTCSDNQSLCYEKRVNYVDINNHQKSVVQYSFEFFPDNKVGTTKLSVQVQSKYDLVTGRKVESITFNSNQKKIDFKRYNSQTGKLVYDYDFFANQNISSIKKYYSNGKLEKTQLYYGSGITKSQSQYYSNGRLKNSKAYNTTGKTSSYRSWWSNGKIKSKSVNLSSNQSSISNYDIRGRITSNNKYNSQGKITVAKTYYSNGRYKKVSYRNQNGQYTGSVTYFANGKKANLYQYHSNGKIKYRAIYYQNGKLRSVHKYNSRGKVVYGKLY